MRLLLLLLLLIVPSTFAADIAEDPLERETLAIGAELRCTVCQNQAISESDADLARDMRAIIREQLAAGKSREEIIRYFVERYGDYVLMKPPYRGPGFLVWFGPLVLLLVLGVSALFYLRRRLRAPLPPAPPLSAEDAERVRRARERQPL